jgi:hypothetical protein
MWNRRLLIDKKRFDSVERQRCAVLHRSQRDIAQRREAHCRSRRCKARHSNFKQLALQFFFSPLNSTGKSIPTLLAVNLTLSSSSMFIPGLYLSTSVAYSLWDLK